MPRIQLYLGNREYQWAKEKPKGFLRKVIARELADEQKRNLKSPSNTEEPTPEVGE